MSQLSHRVAARFLAQEETAGLFFPDPGKVQQKLKSLFDAVQHAAEIRNAETIGDYMAEIARIYRQHPELQKEGRVLQT